MPLSVCRSSRSPHYDAGVKASIVFLRRLDDGEVVSDDEPIFMAMADNIGYDATGRSTFSETVEKEAPLREKVEIHSCDLFDQRVFFEWSADESDWSERRARGCTGHRPASSVESLQ